MNKSVFEKIVVPKEDYDEVFVFYEGTLVDKEIKPKDDKSKSSNNLRRVQRKR